MERREERRVVKERRVAEVGAVTRAAARDPPARLRARRDALSLALVASDARSDVRRVPTDRRVVPREDVHVRRELANHETQDACRVKVEVAPAVRATPGG